MYDLESSRACGAGRRSRGERDVVIPCAGVVRKERWQTGAAHVRCGMYDVRFGKFARVARGRRRLAAPMYDVGCTMYDLEVPAGCKQPSFSGIFDALYGYEA